MGSEAGEASPPPGLAALLQRAGWHRWALLAFPCCSWASPDQVPAPVLPHPLLCTCFLLGNCNLPPAKGKGNGTGYLAAGPGTVHLIGEIIKGFAFTTCQRPLLQTMTLIAVHFWHCLSVADPSVISICSSFSSSL